MKTEEKANATLCQTFAEAMPQMAFIADPDGSIIYYNKRCYDYIGRIDDIEGLSWANTSIHHPDDIKKTAEQWKRSLETGVPFEMEYRLRRHDGQYRWHLGRAEPVINENGNIELWLTTNTDIHVQKIAKEELRQKESYYRMMTDNTPVMTWITDLKGYCTYLNKQWYDFTGQNEENGLGFGWLSVLHPEDATRTEEIFKDALKNQIKFQLEYRIKRYDGNYFWHIGSGLPRFDKNGNFEGFTVAVIDIHESKSAQSALAESEEKYRGLFDSMDQGFCILEMIFDDLGNAADYRFLEINPLFAQQTGLNNAKGKTALELVPNLEKHWIEIYGEVAKTGKAKHFTEGSDAMGRWFDVNAFKIGGEKSNKVALLFTDITEKRKFEKDHKQLASIIEATTDFVGLSSAAGKGIYINPSGLDIIGRKEVSEINVIDCIYPDDRDYAEKHLLPKLYSDGKFEEEIRFLNHQSGEPVWMMWRGITIKDEQSGKITALATISSDISERKKTEAALKNAQQMLQLALSSGSIDIWIWDIKKDKFTSGEMLSKVFDLNPDMMKSEGLTLAEVKKSIHPDDLTTVEKLIEIAINTGKPYEASYRVIGSENKIRWVIARGQVDYDKHGKPARFAGVLVDVTDQKEAEEAVKQSHYQLNLITDAVPTFIAYVDKEERYVFANKEYERWFEKSQKDILGKKIVDVVGSEAYKRSAALIKKALSGDHVLFDTQLQRKGRIRYIEVEYLPDTDLDGSVKGIVVVGHDITARKIAEEALRQSENDFRTLADNIPNLCWMANAEGWIYWYNARWYEYTGTTPEEMEGWGWEKVHHPDELPRVLKEWKHSIASGEPADMVFPLKGADDIYRQFLTRIVPVKNAQGHVKQWFGTNTDITERENLARQKDEFISVASHELKTPLTIVKAYMQLLEKQIREPVQADYLKKTHEYVDQINILVSDLLDVSRILSGKLQFNFEEVDLSEVIEKTIESVSNIYSNHLIKVEQYPEQAIVEGDKMRIEQVLINLLNNGIKYSPNADSISIRIEKKNEEIVVSVTDFGIGIPKDKQKKLFDRFYRIEEKSEQFSGLGIGLYIVSEIIRGHNGQVWLESEPGIGSTFYFSLPLKLDD